VRERRRHHYKGGEKEKGTVKGPDLFRVITLSQKRKERGGTGLFESWTWEKENQKNKKKNGGGKIERGNPKNRCPRPNLQTQFFEKKAKRGTPRKTPVKRTGFPNKRGGVGKVQGGVPRPQAEHRGNCRPVRDCKKAGNEKEGKG